MNEQVSELTSRRTALQAEITNLQRGADAGDARAASYLTQARYDLDSVEHALQAAHDRAVRERQQRTRRAVELAKQAAHAQAVYEDAVRAIVLELEQTLRTMQADRRRWAEARRAYLALQNEDPAVLGDLQRAGVDTRALFTTLPETGASSLSSPYSPPPELGSAGKLVLDEIERRVQEELAEERYHAELAWQQAHFIGP